jgi:hypothetical protein
MILWIISFALILQATDHYNLTLQTTQITPHSSETIIFPNNLMTQINAEYYTTIQYQSNWEDSGSSGDYLIITQQNWTNTSSTGISVNTSITQNQTLTYLLPLQLSYDINSTNGTPQNPSLVIPAVLAGNWEHTWPQPNLPKYTINVQELSYSLNNQVMANITKRDTTTINFTNTILNVIEYTTTFPLRISCG